MVIICAHCGTQTNGKYCPQCKTQAGRREMDDNNDKLFKKAGLKGYDCKVCKPKNT